MRVSSTNSALANELRKVIQARTDTVSDGEGVAMFLLWSFFMDHSMIESIDIELLALQQMEAFIEYAKDNLELVQEH